jgi:hypothetical protein
MKLFLPVLANIMGHGETKGKEMYWDHVRPLKRESVCVCVCVCVCACERERHIHHYIVWDRKGVCGFWIVEIEED